MKPEPVGTPGPVREHAESVSSGAPGADLQPPVPDRAAVPASSGSPAHRNPADGAADDRTAQEESAPEQGDGSAGWVRHMNSLKAQAEGDHSGRADLHLNFDGSEQLSLLNLMDVPPSEAEQIRRIDEAERAMPSAFFRSTGNYRPVSALWQQHRRQPNEHRLRVFQGQAYFCSGSVPSDAVSRRLWH